MSQRLASVLLENALPGPLQLVVGESSTQRLITHELLLHAYIVWSTAGKDNLHKPLSALIFTPDQMKVGHCFCVFGDVLHLLMLIGW